MKINSQELREKLNSNEYFIVDFYADWCGPCRMMGPAIDSASKKLLDEGHKVKVYKFNIEEDKDLAVSLGIRSIPNTKRFVNGNEVVYNIGSLSEGQIIEMANQMIL